MVSNAPLILLISLTVFFGAQILSTPVLAQETACDSKNELSPSLQEKEKLLIQTLQDQEIRETSPEKVIEAIKQVGNLGRLRFNCSKKPTVSNEAIIALTNLLNFKREQKAQDDSEAIVSFHPIPPEGFYPAVDALMNVGDGSLPALIEVIKSEEGYSQKSHNALYVIKFFYRSKRQECFDYLILEASKAESEEGRQRLLLATTKLPIQI